MDLETTGLSNVDDRIVEIAFVVYQDDKLIDSYQKYVNPGMPIPDEVYKIHGINDEKVRDEPQFAHYAQEVSDLLADSKIIIHNAQFDIGFLDAAMVRANLPSITDRTDIEIVCSLQLSRRVVPELSRYTLDALCDNFQVNRHARADFHGAKIDADLLAEVYFKMTSGQGDLQFLNRQSADASAKQLVWQDAIAVELSAKQEAEHAKYLTKHSEQSEGGLLWHKLT